MDFNFNLPTKIVFKRGKLKSCKKEIEKFISKNSKLLICIGDKSAKQNGYLEILLNQLESYKTVIFEGIMPNPLLSKAEEGLILAKKEKIGAIIALGGGSTMDTAKAIAIAYANNVKIEELWNHKTQINKKVIPLIMIPTTSATSSEINQYSVLSDKNKKGGFGVSPYMCPDLAIIDPLLTITLSKRESQATIGDILAHSFESFWSTRSNEFTRFFAGKAIKLLFEYGEKSIRDLKDEELREKISLASVYAGFSFGHASCNVGHSISYPLTMNYGVTHGFACAVTLPVMYEYISENSDLSELNKVLEVKSPSEGMEKIDNFLIRVGIKNRLSAYAIKEPDLDIILEKAHPYREDVLPIKISKGKIKSLLSSIL